jgi:GT2 family glycosyltransferase
MTLVSVVIVNFNGGDSIIKCIRALYRQKVPIEEIIVVDNGSTDGSPDRIRLKFPEVKLVELGENKGAPKARNIGLQLSTTELVLILDDDVYLEEDCLHHMLKAYRRNQPTVICPRVVLIPESGIVQADGAAAHFLGTMILRHGYLPVEKAPAEPTSVDGCLSACLLVHRARVLEAGGFDEDYFIYLEDLEFSIRLRAFGHHFICEPAAVVYHDRGLGTPGLSFRGKGKYPSRRAYLTLRNRLITIFVHYRIRTLAVLMPALAFYELACLVITLLRGLGAEWARAWLWQVYNAQSISQRRKWVQRARKLSDRDLLVGGPLPFSPGFIRSRIEVAALNTLSTILNTYWRIVKHQIG